MDGWVGGGVVDVDECRGRGEWMGGWWCRRGRVLW